MFVENKQLKIAQGFIHNQCNHHNLHVFMWFFLREISNHSPIPGLCVGFFSQHKRLRNFSLKNTYPAKCIYLYLSKKKGYRGWQTCFAEIWRAKKKYSLKLHCKRETYVLSDSSEACFMSLPKNRKNRIPTLDPSQCANEQMADII